LCEGPETFQVSYENVDATSFEFENFSTWPQAQSGPAHFPLVESIRGR